jgi:hypothetical protein
LATPLEVDPRATPGPYCCFTGRSVRPWHRRALLLLFHVINALALMVYALELTQEELNPTSRLTIGIALAVLALLSGLSPRWSVVTLVTSLVLAVRGALTTQGEEHPLDLSEFPSWAQPVSERLESADSFLAQAAHTSAFSLGATIHAIVTVLALVGLVMAIARSWRLTERLWFARFHPVWRRPIALHESPYPILGVLAVHRDPLLAQKLVWLRMDRQADALRIGARGPQEYAHAPRIPLAEQLGDLVLLREGQQWHISGALPGGGHAELRSLLLPLHPAGRKGLGQRRYADVERLPVRDFFADQNALFGKRARDGYPPRLFGLLIDGRQEANDRETSLPRFCVLVEREGAVELEYGHPDLERRAPLELDDDTVRLAWRSTANTTRTLTLERGVDAVHWIETDDDAYALLFLSFGAHG